MIYFTIRRQAEARQMPQEPVPGRPGRAPVNTRGL